MATLVELREALFPAARPVGAEVAGGIVGWVRVLRGRTPALDVLEAGDLVIVPASALAIVAPGLPETAALVEALARAPVSGLLLVDGEGERAGGPGPLDALAEAAAAAGLPAYRLADPETGALERSVIGFLVNRRAELDRQAAALEDRLHALALGGADPEALAAAVGGFLARRWRSRTGAPSRSPSTRRPTLRVRPQTRPPISPTGGRPRCGWPCRRPAAPWRSLGRRR